MKQKLTFWSSPLSWLIATLSPAPKPTRVRQKFERRDCDRCGKKDVAHSKAGRPHPHNCRPDILTPMPTVEPRNTRTVTDSFTDRISIVDRTE